MSEMLPHCAIVEISTSKGTDVVGDGMIATTEEYDDLPSIPIHGFALD